MREKLLDIVSDPKRLHSTSIPTLIQISQDFNDDQFLEHMYTFDGHNTMNIQAILHAICELTQPLRDDQSFELDYTTKSRAQYSIS
jgi:hypothetical protein